MKKLTQRLNKIYQKLDSIAKKGKDGYLSYSEYLDELLSNGEWSLFDEVMIRKYQINIQLYNSVQETKMKTFDIVRFNTLTKFQDDLKGLYLFYGVYQNIYDILLLSDNTILGQIKEFDNIDGTISLEVIKDNTSSILDDVNTTLIDKYKAAIIYLVA